ncbi:hypothetical protein HNR48_002207 [Pseudoteredinibacter isoporae]|uniref:Uncharacterized protein n=1 Tax=Pseudoteredinibacter isoporae TaxID=570281 RepID=A0A7X0JTF3_9GAMM|nr:hypothetical protein [Pseudoteredinibacter isoporae]
MIVLAEIQDQRDRGAEPRFLNGLRCVISYEGMPAAECGVELSGGITEIYPGESAEVFIHFVTPELHVDKLKVGDTFELVRVPYSIATGTVIDL